MRYGLPTGMPYAMQILMDRARKHIQRFVSMIDMDVKERGRIVISSILKSKRLINMCKKSIHVGTTRWGNVNLGADVGGLTR